MGIFGAKLGGGAGEGGEGAGGHSVVRRWGVRRWAFRLDLGLIGPDFNLQHSTFYNLYTLVNTSSRLNILTVIAKARTPSTKLQSTVSPKAPGSNRPRSASRIT